MFYGYRLLNIYTHEIICVNVFFLFFLYNTNLQILFFWQYLIKHCILHVCYLLSLFFTKHVLFIQIKKFTKAVCFYVYRLEEHAHFNRVLSEHCWYMCAYVCNDLNTLWTTYILRLPTRMSTQRDPIYRDVIIIRIHLDVSLVRYRHK